MSSRLLRNTPAPPTSAVLNALRTAGEDPGGRPAHAGSMSDDLDRRVTRPLTGDEYIESLRDDREVYLYGERVKDVTEHPAFRNPSRMVARQACILRTSTTMRTPSAPSISPATCL